MPYKNNEDKKAWRKRWYHKNKKSAQASMKKWRRDFEGKKSALYMGVRNRAKKFNRGFTFSREEFFKFLETSNYSNLYTVWAKNGFKLKESPTVDRIDNDRGYHLNNIQIITHSQNSSKGNRVV